MVATITLKAQKREITGKGQSRALKRDGMIPAVIYNKDKSMMVAMPHKEIFHQYTHNPSFMAQLITLDIDGEKHQVITRDIQLHPVTDFIEHVDFGFVSAKDQVKVKVHFHFINDDKSVGVKRGGVINIIMRDLELFCPATKIPAAIDIDLSTLDIGQSLHLKDLKLPTGCKLAAKKADLTIVTVVGGSASKEEATPAAAAPESK